MTTTLSNSCAQYLRVSSAEQCLENQRPDLDRIAQSRGLEVVVLYEEKVSAVKKRPEYERMMVAAHRGEFKTLVIWSLDRLGRSMQGNVEALLKLDAAGIRVVSVQEPWLDTAGPVRDLLVSIFSWVAQQERKRISERTKAGLDRAKRKGRKLGRPKKWVNVDQALELRSQGLSIRQTARRMKLGASTLHRILQEHDAASA